MAIDVKNLIETQRKMQKTIADLHGTPMLKTMRSVTFMVSRDVQILTPVDRGELRGSVTPQVTLKGTTVIGIVGTNVVYAPDVEFGTRPHQVPPGALATWASRHGIPEFLVQRSIAKYGTSMHSQKTRGTKGYEMFQRGFKQNRSNVIDKLNKTVRGII
jgi:phage gpG-like protein